MLVVNRFFLMYFVWERFIKYLVLDEVKFNWFYFEFFFNFVCFDLSKCYCFIGLKMVEK